MAVVAVAVVVSALGLAAPARALSPAPPTPAAGPGAAAHSWYVGDLDPGRLRALGAADAARADRERLRRSVTVLDLGDPDVEPGSTQLPDHRGSATAATAQAAVVAFGQGWVSLPGAPPLVLVVGTSNYGDHVDAAHGQAWGRLVGRVAAALPPGVDVRGGLDAEPSYGPAPAALAFLAGYVEATVRPFVDFGDCPCTPGQALPTGWTRDDRAALAGAGSVLPQQYRTSGIDARRWASLDADVRRRSGHPTQVLGVLTQIRACSGPPARDCAGTDQRPTESLASLSAALGRGVSEATDIGYLAPPPAVPPGGSRWRVVAGAVVLVLLAVGAAVRTRRRTRRRPRGPGENRPARGGAPRRVGR